MTSLSKEFWRAETVSTARRKFKSQCIEYKGGSCQKCGYNTCMDALTFHHVDPAHKDFQISKVSLSRKSFELCKLELDKCDLLCANCHAEVHYHMRADAKMEMLEVVDEASAWETP